MVGVQDTACALTDAEQRALNALGLNCFRTFPAIGPLLWGNRTLVGAAAASEWKYIAVRRLALYIEESIYRGTQWAAFEPNGAPLWAALRGAAEAFMHDLFERDAFPELAPDRAYFVRCGQETTTQADIDQGVVNILVGFAPLQPAEFIVLRIRQKARA